MTSKRSNPQGDCCDGSVVARDRARRDLADKMAREDLRRARARRLLLEQRLVSGWVALALGVLLVVVGLVCAVANLVATPVVASFISSGMGLAAWLVRPK